PSLRTADRTLSDSNPLSLPRSLNTNAKASLRTHPKLAWHGNKNLHSCPSAVRQHRHYRVLVRRPHQHRRCRRFRNFDRFGHPGERVRLRCGLRTDRSVRGGRLKGAVGRGRRVLKTAVVAVLLLVLLPGAAHAPTAKTCTEAELLAGLCSVSGSID